MVKNVLKTLDIQELKAQYRAGLSIHKLASVHNVPYVSLYRILKAKEIKSRYKCCYFCRKKRALATIVTKDFFEKVDWQKKLCHIKKNEFFINTVMARHHVDENRKNNRKINLVDLCWRCHRKLHILYKIWKKGKKRSIV